MPEISIWNLVTSLITLVLSAALAWIGKLNGNLKRIEDESKDRDRTLEVMMLRDLPSKEDMGRFEKELGRVLDAQLRTNERLDKLVGDVAELGKANRGG